VNLIWEDFTRQGLICVTLFNALTNMNNELSPYSIY